jgi:chorismate dehydratase
VHIPAELVTGTPAELNELLVAGELDVSVISAIEYARHAKELVLLPGLAISCDGPVQSVALFSKVPIAQLDGATVLVTASSRTSVALLELLCRDVWHVHPRFVQARAEASDLDSLARLPHEAVLVIGDPALLLAARGTYPHRMDLGAAWKQWTGLPFVFAVWAARRRADGETVRAVHHALLEARTWGLAHLDLLAASAAAATGVPVDDCRSYFAGLDYAFSDTHLAGLSDFFRRLAARGIVPDGSLRFLQVA